MHLVTDNHLILSISWSRVVVKFVMWHSFETLWRTRYIYSNQAKLNVCIRWQYEERHALFCFLDLPYYPK